MMGPFFDLVGWIAMTALILTSVPQIILNFQRKSTDGISWLTFAILLLGMSILFIRSLFTTPDPVIRLNYGLGTLVVLIVNLQLFYYRVIRPRLGEAVGK